MNFPFENAKWIWLGERGEKNVHLSFLLDFDAEGTEEAVLHLSVDFQYALYLNGEFLDYGQYADTEDYKIYDSVPLRGLRAGKNRVLLCAWHEERFTACSIPQEAGVIFSLRLNGREVLFSSETTLCAYDHRYRRDNVSSNQVGTNAVYDEVNAPADQWDKAEAVEKTAVLLPRPVKKQTILPPKAGRLVTKGSYRSTVDEEEHDQGKKAYFAYYRLDDRGRKVLTLPSEEGIPLQKADGDGAWAIVDLGEETVGLPLLHLVLAEDSRVTLNWGEHLEDGRVRSFLGGRNFCLDLTLKKGDNRFLYPFRRAGARYLQVQVASEGALLKELSLLPTEYPLDRSQSFSCSDRLHNRIFEVSRRTLELCMHEHYEDCPWREQALYPMDSRNQMLCGYYAFGELDFPKASLELISKSIRADGLLELTSPSKGFPSIPSFSAVYFVQLWEYMHYSGDVAFAYRMLKDTECILHSFEKQMRPNALAALYPSDGKDIWNYYEWQEGLSGRKTAEGEEVFDAPLNAFISAAYQHAARIYSAAGEKTRADFYQKRAEEINEAIRRVFYSEEEQLFYTRYTEEGGLRRKHQLTQALCVFCGACTEDMLDGVLRTIAYGEVLPATLSHSIFVFDALMKRPAAYARFVFDKIAEDWGAMLYRGATSFWENIKGADDFAYAGSLCHGWSAVPIYFYFRYALGYRHETGEFAPVDCGLYEIKGNVNRLLK